MSGKSIYKNRNKRCDRLATHVFLCSAKNRATVQVGNQIKVKALLKVNVLGPVLYLLYTAPLDEMIQSHGLDYHFYTEDTQLYISFKDCDVNFARLRIENCAADIRHWMDLNKLKINHDQIEIMLIYSKDHTHLLFSYFSMGNERLTTTTNVRSLGVVLDNNV